MPEIRLGQRYSHYFYGHYYAAQAMWIRGGDDWNQWYPAIRDELVSKRLAQGYWNDSVGSYYGTAMALIILQMPNNYLPIFQRESRPRTDFNRRAAGLRGDSSRRERCRYRRHRFPWEGNW